MILLFARHHRLVRLATLVMLLLILGGALVTDGALEGMRWLAAGVLLVFSAVLYAFAYAWPVLADAIEVMNRRLMQNRAPRRFLIQRFFFWFGVAGSVVPLVGFCLAGGLATADELLLALSPAFGLVAGCSHLFHKVFVAPSGPAAEGGGHD